MRLLWFENCFRFQNHQIHIYFVSCQTIGSLFSHEGALEGGTYPTNRLVVMQRYLSGVAYYPYTHVMVLQALPTCATKPRGPTQGLEIRIPLPMVGTVFLPACDLCSFSFDASNKRNATVSQAICLCIPGGSPKNLLQLDQAKESFATKPPGHLPGPLVFTMQIGTARMSNFRNLALKGPTSFHDFSKRGLCILGGGLRYNSLRGYWLARMARVKPPEAIVKGMALSRARMACRSLLV